MHISKTKFREINISIAFFFAFSGYYAILMMTSNIGLSEVSRYFTIPIRFLIVGCLGIIFLMKPKFKLTKTLLYFFIFAFFYYLRIGIEYFDAFSKFHISEIEFFLYFTSFVFFPVILLSNIQFSKEDYRIIFYMIMGSAAFMSLMTLFYYGSLIGEVSRLSNAFSEGEEGFINPLALSYSSSLAIGVGVLYLKTNITSRKLKAFILVVLLLCIPPFLLGASRGSVVALVGSFLAYFLFQRGIANRVKITISGLFAAFLLFVFSEATGSGIIDRFIGIGDELLKTSSSSSIRMNMWKEGIQTFLKYPLLGNTLESEYYSFYPHNIIIEVAMATGVFGLIPFVFFISKLIQKAIHIITSNYANTWIVIIFIQAFLQHMVSGSIYGASWLAIGAGVILGFKTNK